MQITPVTFNELKVGDIIIFFYKGGSRRGLRIVAVTEIGVGHDWVFKGMDRTEPEPTEQRFSWRYIADARMNGWGEPHVLKMVVNTEQKTTKKSSSKAKSADNKVTPKPKAARKSKSVPSKEL